MAFLTIHDELNEEPTDLYYEVSGKKDNPVLVFIHGWLCNGKFWHYFTRLSKEGYRVIVPDLRGHGKTPLSEKLTIELQADDIFKLLEHLNVERAVVIGHSMGGIVTQCFYHKYPEKVVALGLWNTGGQIPFGYGFSNPFYNFNVIMAGLGLMLAYPIPGLFSYAMTKGWAISFYKAWRSNAYKKLKKYVRATSKKAIVKSAGALRKFKGIDKLAEIDVPVMLLHGNKDKFITPKHLIKTLEEKLPNSVSYYVEEAAHFPPNERPEVVYDHLKEFLNSIDY